MAAARSLIAPLLAALLLAGCASGGGEKPVESASPVDTAQVTAEKEEKAAAMAAQREALDTLLEVMRAGEWLAAREMAQELILAHPMLAEAYANMGSIQVQLKDTEKAEQAWLKALQVRPGWAAVSNRLGIFYRQQGRFDEALAMYQQALASDESYASAHRNIAILYELYRGEQQKALQHYRRYQQLLGGEDRQVKMWIVDLERRIERAAR